MHRRLFEAIPYSAEQGLYFHHSKNYLILTLNSIGQGVRRKDWRLRGDLYSEVSEHVHLLP